MININNNVLKNYNHSIYNKKNNEIKIFNKSFQIYQKELQKWKKIEFQMPQNWYQIKKEKKRIKIILPKHMSTIKRVIYIFKNEKKNFFLVGKTGGFLKNRLSSHASNINEQGIENKAVEIGRRTFLTDIKKNPTHFSVGVLYPLKPEDDIDLLETAFIDYMKEKKFQLYNDRKGGGGGLCHDEEKPTMCAIPKENSCLTPTKYYKFEKKADGKIKILTSPNFKLIFAKRAGFYSIKNFKTGKRYIGRTCYLGRRWQQHASAAKRRANAAKRRANAAKSDHEFVSVGLYSPLAKDTNHFGVGVIPIHQWSDINKENRRNYDCISSNKVEGECIKRKKSLTTQNGYNCNKGGGGPIGREPPKAKKTLLFDMRN